MTQQVMVCATNPSRKYSQTPVSCPLTSTGALWLHMHTGAHTHTHAHTQPTNVKHNLKIDMLHNTSKTYIL